MCKSLCDSYLWKWLIVRKAYHDKWNRLLLVKDWKEGSINIEKGERIILGKKKVLSERFFFLPYEYIKWRLSPATVTLQPFPELSCSLWTLKKFFLMNFHVHYEPFLKNFNSFFWRVMLNPYMHHFCCCCCCNPSILSSNGTKVIWWCLVACSLYLVSWFKDFVLFCNVQWFPCFFVLGLLVSVWSRFCFFHGDF